MSEAKFTTGEWVVSDIKVNGVHVAGSWSVGVDGCLIADVTSGPTFGVIDEIQFANAHLIAAAPEMYQKLEHVAEFFESHCEYETAKEFRDLLAKARGEA